MDDMAGRGHDAPSNSDNTPDFGALLSSAASVQSLAPTDQPLAPVSSHSLKRYLMCVVLFVVITDLFFFAYATCFVLVCSGNSGPGISAQII